MGIVGIILLAISLAMDCFSVSLASGMILKRIHRPTLLKMAFFFGLFHLVFRKDVADRDDDVSLAQAAGLNHDSFVVSGVDMLDAPGRELVFVNENYELAFGECHTIAPFL